MIHVIPLSFTNMHSLSICVNLLGKKPHSFNIYKSQVQGVSLSTWGVIRKELCFQLPELTKASRARQNRRG